MAIGKNDGHARDAIGNAYDSIPKSVFATLAYRLADRLDGENAIAMMLEELEALALNGVIPLDQATRAIKSLAE